jgi:hypothetical protein
MRRRDDWARLSDQDVEVLDQIWQKATQMTEAERSARQRMAAEKIEEGRRLREGEYGNRFPLN